MDDIVCEALWHLAGSVLGSFQRMIQVALGRSGDHCGNQRSDGSCRLSEEKENSVNFMHFLRETNTYRPTLKIT